MAEPRYQSLSDECLDNVVTMLADEPITDGGIEKRIGSEGGAEEPGGDDVANAVSLSLKLCHFGGGYRPLCFEQQDTDVGFIAHLGATPKIRGATVAAKQYASANRLRSDRG
jgi:hypothetical protein